MLKLDEDSWGWCNTEDNPTFLKHAESELNHIAEECGVSFDNEDEIPYDLLFDVMTGGGFDIWRKFCTHKKCMQSMHELRGKDILDLAKLIEENNLLDVEMLIEGAPEPDEYDFYGLSYMPTATVWVETSSDIYSQLFRWDGIRWTNVMSAEKFAKLIRSA